MFVQNFIKLSEAVHEFWCSRRLAMMLKTILPSLPRPVVRNLF